MIPYNKKIVLENGNEFFGYGFGADIEAINEIVFNTSMVGYQEIMSDPSYTDQMVVMTYPLIGNYGITDEDFTNPSKKSFEALRKYAIDYNLINDNPKGRK